MFQIPGGKSSGYMERNQDMFSRKMWKSSANPASGGNISVGENSTSRYTLNSQDKRFGVDMTAPDSYNPGKAKANMATGRKSMTAPSPLDSFRTTGGARLTGPNAQRSMNILNPNFQFSTGRQSQYSTPLERKGFAGGEMQGANVSAGAKGPNSPQDEYAKTASDSATAMTEKLRAIREARSNGGKTMTNKGAAVKRDENPVLDMKRFETDGVYRRSIQSNDSLMAQFEKQRQDKLRMRESNPGLAATGYGALYGGRRER